MIGLPFGNARRMAALLLVLLPLVTTPARAVKPDEILPDPALEARARALSQELRCMVCQNESIDDSNADLAHDLRVLVRERLLKGDSDTQVVQYLRARYGDFVLLRPPVERATWMLWFGPPALLLILLAVCGWVARSRAMKTYRGLKTEPLAPAERDRLKRLLDEPAAR